MKQWSKEKFLSENTWFHGTLRVYAIDMIVNGINAYKNRNTPSDFGRGLYLCPNEEWALSYATQRVKDRIESVELEPNDGVVIQFEFLPYDYVGRFGLKYYSGMTKEFAKDVFFNWRHPAIPYPKRWHDMIFGPMTDGKQMQLMAKFKNHEISKTDVIKELLKPKEDWQLLIRSQILCNELKVVRTFNLKGDDVDVI